MYNGWLGCAETDWRADMPWHSWRAHKSAQELTTCLSSIRDALPDEEESPKVHSSAEIRAQDQTRAPHVGFKECLNSRVNVTSNSLSTSCKRLNFMIHFNYNLFSVLLSAHDANSCVLCLEKKNFFLLVSYAYMCSSSAFPL